MLLDEAQAYPVGRGKSLVYERLVTAHCYVRPMGELPQLAQDGYYFQYDPATGVFPAELRVEYYYPWCARTSRSARLQQACISLR